MHKPHCVLGPLGPDATHASYFNPDAISLEGVECALGLMQRLFDLYSGRLLMLSTPMFRQKAFRYEPSCKYCPKIIFALLHICLEVSPGTEE